MRKDAVGTMLTLTKRKLEWLLLDFRARNVPVTKREIHTS